MFAQASKFTHFLVNRNLRDSCPAPSGLSDYKGVSRGAGVIPLTPIASSPYAILHSSIVKVGMPRYRSGS